MKLNNLLIIIPICLSLALISFKDFNNKKTVNEDQLVTIFGHVDINIPYSGGASPPPEMANGTYSPSKNTRFHVVLKGDTTKTSIASFVTDTSGQFEIKLPPNEYCFFQSQKMLSYEALCEYFQVPPDEHYAINFCLKRWFNYPDCYVKAAKDTFIRIVLPARHPCIFIDEIDRP